MCESIYKDEEGYNEHLISEDYNHGIKFDEIYKDEWKYCFSDGVGLKFEGVPTDEKAFVEYLQDQSCNPVMSHMICDELQTKGYRYCTVMSHLNFNKIYYDLLKIGVTINIVKPMKMRDNGIFFKSCSLTTSLLTRNKGKTVEEIVERIYEDFDKEILINLIKHHYEYIVVKIDERKTGLGLYK